MNLRNRLGSIAVIGCAIGAPDTVANTPDSGPDLARVRQKLSASSVPFVPNAGQWDARAAFAAQTFAGTLFVSTDGQLVYTLPGPDIDDPAADAAKAGPAIRTASAPKHPHPSRARLRGPGGVLTETLLDREGRAVALTPRGLRPQSPTVSYFIGADASRHRSTLDTFEQVSLGEMAPGIDVRLRATGSNVEKIFTIAPARDPGVIRVRIGGADRLALGANGELVARTQNGPVSYTAPIAYQDDASGRRSIIPVRYALAGTETTYGFALGEYDRTRPLIIDPLLQATYHGGLLEDVITAMVVHPVSGEVLVAGYTLSSDMPGTANGYQPNASSASYEGFIARLNASLTSRLQVTYLGGSVGGDVITALAIHPVSGEVLVAGYTTSTDFPGTTGSAQAAHAANATGGFDGFVARLNANLTSLLRATYFGGTGSDYITAMAVHPVTGEVLATGYTNSTNLPCTVLDVMAFCDYGAQYAHAADGGLDDAFVARFDANLTRLWQATYFGGSFYDHATAIAIHPVSGEVLIAGYTDSFNLLCTTASATCAAGAQPAHAADAGTYDGFIARMSADLTILLQATYLGGTNLDQINAIAVHPVSGEVLVAGSTTSFTLPCTTTATSGCGNAAQTAHSSDGSQLDGFVARLSANLTRLLQTTYLGGSASDEIVALAIHPATGEVLVAGHTTSFDLPCTVANPATLCNTGAQTAHAAIGGGVGYDGFVARLNAGLTGLLQSTYLGGSRDDLVHAIAIHPVNGEVLVAGQTKSGNFGCYTVAVTCTVGGAQPAIAIANGTVDDGFVARFSADLTHNDTIPNTFAFAPQNSVPLSSVRTSNPVLIGGTLVNTVVYVDGQPGSRYCVSTTNSCLCDVSVDFIAAPSGVGNNSYVCVRHTASAALNEVTKTVLHAGGIAAPFIVTTGALVGSNCKLDIDGNNNVDALTDGLMLIRAMFGLTGTAVTNNAIGGGATRSTWAQIRPFLNGNCGTNFSP